MTVFVSVGDEAHVDLAGDVCLPMVRGAGQANKSKEDDCQHSGYQTRLQCAVVPAGVAVT